MTRTARAALLGLGFVAVYLLAELLAAGLAGLMGAR